MKTVEFGATGVMVSELCLGTMMFADRCDYAASEAIVNAALAHGINFVDTAAMYTAGTCEEFLGRILKGRRDRVFLGTKVAKGIDRASILSGLDESLARLQTDYVDLYMIHWPVQGMNVTEVMAALNETVVSGKARFVGCCNYPAWLVAHSNAIAERNGWAKLVCNQVAYNLIERGVEVEILPQAVAEKIAITAYRPLAIGLLAGKFSTTTPMAAETRGKTDSRVITWLSQHGSSIDRFNRFAQGAGHPPGQPGDGLGALLGCRHLPDCRRELAAATGGDDPGRRDRPDRRRVRGADRPVQHGSQGGGPAAFPRPQVQLPPPAAQSASPFVERSEESMNISIASYAFHGLLREGKMDVFGYLETCKYRYGLASADIWNGFLPTIEDDYLAKLKDGLEERELVLANLCVDGPHIWEDDPEVRAKHHADGLAYLRAAELLGARTVRIDAGVRAETFTDEQFDAIVARYREYAQRALRQRLSGRAGEPLGRGGRAGEHGAHLPGGGSSRLRHVAALPRQRRRRVDGAVGDAHACLDGSRDELAGAEHDDAARRGLRRLLGRRASLRPERICRGRHPGGAGARRAGAVADRRARRLSCVEAESPWR